MASVVIATVPVSRRRCPATVVVSKWDLWRDGTLALYRASDGTPRLETVAASRGLRPWSLDSRRW